MKGGEDFTKISIGEILNTHSPVTPEESVERAAIPKEIAVLDEIPLTPVGKIFKPALRWDAINRVYQSEIEELAPFGEHFEVAVGEDMLHGSVVSIRIKPGAEISTEKISASFAELIPRLTVKYRLKLIED